MESLEPDAPSLPSALLLCRIPLESPSSAMLVGVEIFRVATGVERSEENISLLVSKQFLHSKYFFNSDLCVSDFASSYIQT